jgi:hypothetical protein
MNPIELFHDRTKREKMHRNHLHPLIRTAIMTINSLSANIFHHDSADDLFHYCLHHHLKEKKEGRKLNDLYHKLFFEETKSFGLHSSME